MKSKNSTEARTGKMVKRDGTRSAAGGLSQATISRSSRNEKSSQRRTELSADELALRAWKTTYKNRRASIE